MQLGDMGLWLSIMCLDYTLPPEEMEEDLKAVKSALQRTTLPTLVGMERMAPGQQGQGQQQGQQGQGQQGQEQREWEPTMFLFRSKKGLRGFAGANFNAMRVVYLDEKGGAG